MMGSSISGLLTSWLPTRLPGAPEHYRSPTAKRANCHPPIPAVAVVAAFVISAYLLRT
jgi:hypothetical protein